MTRPSASDVYWALYDEISRYGYRLSDRGPDGVVRDCPPNGLLDWSVRRMFAALVESGVDVGDWEAELFVHPTDTAMPYPPESENNND